MFKELKIRFEFEGEFQSHILWKHIFNKDIFIFETHK